MEEKKKREKLIGVDGKEYVPANMVVENAGIIKDILDSEEILEREIVGLGNSAHITIPVKHKGKIARIFVQKKGEVKK